jgi:hypothetical protein
MFGKIFQCSLMAETLLSNQRRIGIEVPDDPADF